MIICRNSAKCTLRRCRKCEFKIFRDKAHPKYIGSTSKIGICTFGYPSSVCNCDIFLLSTHIPLAKHPLPARTETVHGRCIRSAKTERKVRTPQSRIPRASEGRASRLGRQVSQKTNRPRERVRVKRRGKSPPHEQRCSRQDKPNPVQDEIGSRVARPKASGSSHPQGHNALRFFAMRREINECNLSKVQNPAYRP